MLHPALFLLLQLRFWAALRQIKANIRSPKKLVIYGVIVVWFLMSFGPSLFLSGSHRVSNPETARLVFAGFLFFFFLMNFFLSAGERAITFRPCEIDFLFTAPFSRKQLVMYKVVSSLCLSLFPGLIFTFVFRPHAGGWGQAIAGAFLTLVFLQFNSMIFALLRQSVTVRLYSRFRQAVLVGLLAIAGGAFLQTVSHIHMPTLEEWQQIAQSPWITALLAPFLVFASIITTPDLFPHGLIWIAIAVGINLALLAAVLMLDANFLEASWAATQRTSVRIQNFQKGQMFLSSQYTGEIRSSLPPFPWLGGMGPVFWKQVLQFKRSSKILYFVLFGIPILAGPVLTFLGPEDKTQYILLGGLAYFTFLLSFHFRCDFRGDLDAIPYLKVLPISPFQIVLAEIALPIVILSAMHGLAVLSYSIFSDSLSLVMGSILLFALPINLTITAIQNFTFLLFPTRITQNTAGDMQHFGRGLAIFFLIFILLVGFFGLSTAAGGLLYWGLAAPILLCLFTAWVVLVGCCLLTIPMIWWAYERFDVMEIPAKM
ncbi:MAG: putative ABC exporter domain-containing protein [bacterium]|jgi:hypothetical protein|nr:putative ABC exporter domain-containing protein [bacterium]